MRWTTSALTAAFLGAILTTSTVEAQQSSSAGGELVEQSAVSDAIERGNSARNPTVDPIYGMSNTRGARYLLRNGLDYLNYREYERALRFLRETESRKNELSTAEKLVLKKSIERAQRGLRQAADAEPPYALSDLTRGRIGFSPAKANTHLASQVDQSKAPAHKTLVNHSNFSGSSVSDSEDQGESIRLVSGDTTKSNSNNQDPNAPRLGQNESDSAVSHHYPDQPRQLPEILNPSSLSKQINEANTQSSTFKGDNKHIITSPSYSGENQLETSPVSNQAVSATRAQSLAIVPLSSAMLPLSASELDQPVPLDPARGVQSGLTAVDSKTKFSPFSPSKNVATADLTPVVHAETEESMPPYRAEGQLSAAPSPVISSYPTSMAQKNADSVASMETDQSTHTKTVNSPKQLLPALTALTTVGTASADTDDLPPLPVDLTGLAIARHSQELTAMSTPTANTPTQAQDAESELPTLPDDLSHPAKQPADLRTSSTIPGDTQDLSTRSPDASPGRHTIGSNNLVPELSSPHSSGHKEEEEITVSRSDHSENRVDIVLPSTVASSTSVQPSTPRPSSAIEQGLLSTGAELIVISSSSAVVGANQEPAQEAQTVVSPVIEQSHAPSSLPSAIKSPARLSSRVDLILPNLSKPPSTLRPELQREVEMIVRKQEDELRSKQQVQQQPAIRERETIISDLRAQTQLDISRAPSPAEARPIKAIPVPEDWVPLAPRNWSAQRKYWAAAATCHLPLYFQDPVLEHYGHSVEQFIGPIGRYLTYPLDDPTQSTQRNQILQPLFSYGLFAFQIAALPYNVIMDPPWESQYDLGYYRPGDVIPTDLYWLPLHGYGPPLRGSSY